MTPFEYYTTMVLTLAGMAGTAWLDNGFFRLACAGVIFTMSFYAGLNGGRML